MDCPHCQSMFADAADDRLGESPHRQFIEHLRGCTACESAWGAYRRSLWALHKLPAAALPAGFHNRLHARLAEAVRQPAPGPWWQRAPRMAYASAAVVLLAAGGVWVASQMHLNKQGALAPATAGSAFAENTQAPPDAMMQSRGTDDAHLAPPRPTGATPERLGAGDFVRADHVRLRVDEQARTVIVAVDPEAEGPAVVAVHGLKIASLDTIAPGQEAHYPFPATAGERLYAPNAGAQFHLFVGGLAPKSVVARSIQTWDFRNVELGAAIESLCADADIALLIEGPLGTKLTENEGARAPLALLRDVLEQQGYHLAESDRAWVAIKK